MIGTSTITRICTAGPATTYKTDTYPIGGTSRDDELVIIASWLRSMARAGAQLAYCGGTLNSSLYAGEAANGEYILFTVDYSYA